ncbi:Uncharacterized protein C14C4.10c [Choanephora cucurbitarum]|uniref:Uncharacterized protein C14C4.10c n=1 Tax=Choanephora cucurbitarum TaxID=101091 RepID=A0A1C7NL51_9FUNG|nr:Uncharacterized protein C14C4.10c [Choanephora cucurbitarum]
MTSDNFKTFRDLVTNLSQHQPIHIPSPPKQKRRGAVAAILRWHCPSRIVSNEKIETIHDFLEQPWVNQSDGYAEILFMQRTARPGDRWSGHVAFVGGKNEPGETDQETVEREVREEIGVDLSDHSKFLLVGKLDEREITSLKDNALVMILIPFVYLQIVPDSPPFQLQTSEVASVQWVPLPFFLSENSYSCQLITEALPIVRKFNSKWLQKAIQVMTGSVQFPAVDLPTQQHFRLWGLTMGMTSDLVQFTQKKHLAFVQMTRKEPVYSRIDIKYLTRWITQLTLLLKNKTYVQPMKMSMLERCFVAFRIEKDD